VHVAQLLEPFVVREDVEVVVPSLPEWAVGEPTRDGDLQRLYRGSKWNFVIGWLGHKEVNVLGHDDIPQHLESVALPVQFERQQKRVLRMRRA